MKNPQIMDYNKCSKPGIYLDISIDRIFAGRIEIDLFWDILPITCQIFRNLATGKLGYGYKNSNFHYILKNNWIMGGAIAEENNKIHLTNYEEEFKNPTFNPRNSEKGYVSISRENVNENKFIFKVDLNKNK